MYTSCLWLSTSSNESLVRTAWIFRFAGIESGCVYGPHGPLEHPPGGSGEWPSGPDGTTWLRLRSTWGRDYSEKDNMTWREMGCLCILFATMLGAPIFCKWHKLSCVFFFRFTMIVTIYSFFPIQQRTSFWHLTFWQRMFRNLPRWVLDWKVSELPAEFLVSGPSSRNAWNRPSTKPLGSSNFPGAKCKTIVFFVEKHRILVPNIDII